MHDNIQGGALTESTFLVLLVLSTPLHGYGIIKETTELTNGRVKLGPGTLYGILKNLEKKKWIVKEGSDKAVKKNQILYSLTEEGMTVLNKEIDRLNELCDISKEVLNDRGR